jgi:hypothetical protein
MLKAMDKRKLHHLWTRLRPVNAMYFLTAAGILLFIGVLAMRQNNLTAIKLRDEVAKVDEADGDVETALRNLREHVYAHMNSDLSGGSSNVQQPVQLKFRYERLIAAEKSRVSQENEKIYNAAQEDCERRFPQGLSGGGRVPCIEEYVSSRSLKEQPIPDALYKFDFAAPAWSPDLAGISLVLSAIFLLLFFVRLALDWWIKARINEHQ